MNNVWLHRFAVVVSICTLFLVVAGGLVTSNDAGLSVPDWPLSYGSWMPPMIGGCDIGYALAASSCEGAFSVDACTVTALDAITAFAVPNPNCPSQSRRFFQVWLLFGSPRRANHSAYFGLAKFLFRRTLFSRRRKSP